MADNGDMRSHENTYGGFLSLMKWGTIGSVIVTAFVIFLITQ